MNINEWLKDNNNNEICIYAPDYKSVDNNLQKYQTNANNIFGSILTYTGGISFENTIRIFGSTCDVDRRDILKWNELYGNDNIIIIGDDIYGGVFAINIKLDKITYGNICYFAPDTLMWEDLNVSLKNFMVFLKIEDLSKLYPIIDSKQYNILKKLKVGFNEMLSFYPPQWSKEFKTQGFKYHLINVTEYYDSIVL